MIQVYGFPEDDARRIVNGVASFEKFRQRNKNPTNNDRVYVRITGAGTSNPAPPAAFACQAGELVEADDTDPSGYVATSADSLFVIYDADATAPDVGDVLTAKFLWTDDDGVGVYLGQLAGGGGGASVDHVHVVGQAGQLLTCRRVTIGSPGGWPPVETDPVVEYTGVFESENRDARIIDSPGTATHIIPLFRDADGNYYVVFWKVDTQVIRNELTDVTGTVVQNEDCTFTLTLSKTYTPTTHSITVTPPGNPDTGLTLTITT